MQILGTTIEPRPNPQADRFRFLGSFRQNGVLPMRWRDGPWPEADLFGISLMTSEPPNLPGACLATP